MKAIFRHEFESYFKSMTGYVFIGFLLLFVGIYSYVYNLHSLLASFEYVLSGMSFIFLIIVPVITMKVIAEEKKQKTDQLLYSLPVTMTEVVMGKYLALLALMAIPTAVICIYPLILNFFGDVNLAGAYGAIAGFYFLGAALLAVGMFVSSITENQALAAGITFVLLLVNYFIYSLASYLPSTSYASLIAFAVLAVLIAFVFWLMTKNSYASFIFGVAMEVILIVLYIIDNTWFSNLFPDVMSQISLFERFNNFVDGIFDITAIVFFLSVAGFFIYLSIQSLEKRRWS